MRHATSEVKTEALTFRDETQVLREMEAEFDDMDDKWK